MQGMCAQVLAVLAICAAWAGGGIDTTDWVACTWFGAHFIMGIMFHLWCGILGVQNYSTRAN